MAHDRFTSAVLEGRRIVTRGDGKRTRDFTCEDDITDTVVPAQLATAGAVMNVGGGNRANLAVAIGTLREVPGITPRVAVQSAEFGDVRHGADVNRADRSTGSRPATTLAEGMPQELTWLAGNRKLVP